jgi:NUMOD4 motif/HNH endonuclease
MVERWKDIVDYEGRYQVSDQGRVKALSFMQRYLLRNGKEAYRRTKEKILAQQPINSGYLIVHLHLSNKRIAHLVHRLVAEAFLPPPVEDTVNHKNKNGDKTNNLLDNLEWATYTNNHLHAVKHRLNKQAIPVVNPTDGVRYDSIAQAAKGAHKNHRHVAATFTRVDQCPL